MRRPLIPRRMLSLAIISTVGFVLVCSSWWLSYLRADYWSLERARSYSVSFDSGRIALGLSEATIVGLLHKHFDEPPAFSKPWPYADRWQIEHRVWKPSQRYPRGERFGVAIEDSYLTGMGNPNSFHWHFRTLSIAHWNLALISGMTAYAAARHAMRHAKPAGGFAVIMR